MTTPQIMELILLVWIVLLLSSIDKSLRVLRPPNRKRIGYAPPKPIPPKKMDMEPGRKGNLITDNNSDHAIELEP